ncbi:hypothetical protein PAECIP111890_06243 [Paenibacillus sp. JJ-223]|nr:hypothetical protein PAECIP111890_06243 [Paenibacillus sp. JJ-223]
MDKIVELSNSIMSFNIWIFKRDGIIRTEIRTEHEFTSEYNGNG